MTPNPICPNCGGKLYTGYKGGTRWKCLGCSRIFLPGWNTRTKHTPKK